MRVKRILVLVLALTCAAVIQSTITNRPFLLGGRPDLVLLIVVTFSVTRGESEGLVGGVVGGLIVDLLSATPFGAGTIGMGLAGLLTGLGRDNIYRANAVIPLVAVFLSTVFYHGFLMLALQGNGWAVDWIATLALQTIPGAALNAVLSPIAFYFVRKLATSEVEQERLAW